MSEEVIKIRGGNPLKGSVQISGAKNSAVALIPATLMASSPVTLEGLPEISDVVTLMSLLEDLNITTTLDGDRLTVDPSNAVNMPLPNHKVQSLRLKQSLMSSSTVNS